MRPAGLETTMSSGLDDFDDANLEQPAEPEVPPASSGKIILPGALMIATGVINLLIGMYLVGVWFVVGRMSDAEFDKVYEQSARPEQRKQFEDAGYTKSDVRRLVIGFYAAFGIGNLLGSVLSMLGGSLMCARKARGFAILASIITAIPCLTSACCLLGLPIGIWALIVLFQPDVKAAFR
jgi:hypothetical protein